MITKDLPITGGSDSLRSEIKFSEYESYTKLNVLFSWMKIFSLWKLHHFHHRNLSTLWNEWLILKCLSFTKFLVWLCKNKAIFRNVLLRAYQRTLNKYNGDCLILAFFQFSLLKYGCRSDVRIKTSPWVGVTVSFSVLKFSFGYGCYSISAPECYIFVCVTQSINIVKPTVGSVSLLMK